MFFLTPRYLKQGRQFVKDARKLVAYKRDVASPEAISAVEKEIAALDEAVRKRDREAVMKQAEVLDKACGTITKPVENPGLAENVEVFMVAIIVALGVRTYFLQPFTIPTGSMQPTLNGIVFHPTNEPAPNPLLRAGQVAVFGRHYVDFVAKERERLIGVPREIKSLLPFVPKIPGISWGLFSRTEIETVSETGNRRTYIIKEAAETVMNQFFRDAQGHIFQPGEPIIRGYFDAGDHVFVDKVSYNFRTPKRGETFVFSTANIAGITQPGKPSQYYIKRLVGVPGDTLQVRPPQLIINGQCAEEKGMQRVMSGTREQPKDGYRGYGNGAERKNYDQQVYVDEMTYLNNPDATFTVPQREYFAMGDNSFSSYDSRGWGTVPERNVMGRALIVYWPFWPHFGLSK